MSFRAFIVGLFLGFPAGAIGEAEAKVIDRVIAVVNDEIVTWSQLEELLGPVLNQVDDIPDPVTREQQRDKQVRLGLDELIGQHLITQEANKRKLAVSIDDVTAHVERVKRQQKWDDDRLKTYLSAQGLTMDAFRIQVREQLLRQKVIRGVLGERIRISDGDVADYYKTKMTEAGSDVELEAAHIFLPVAPEATPAEEAALKQQAKEIADRALAGEDFGALAKQYSKGPGATNGGSLGTIRRGSLDPDFEDAAFALPDGGISGPVRTRLGFHVIRAIARKKLPAPPLEEVKEDLRRELTDRRMKDEVTKWVEELKKKAFIEVRL